MESPNSASTAGITDAIPLIEVEELFSLEAGGAWINSCQGVTVGSISCPATVASSFSFT